MDAEFFFRHVMDAEYMHCSGYPQSYLSFNKIIFRAILVILSQNYAFDS